MITKESIQAAIKWNQDYIDSNFNANLYANRQTFLDIILWGLIDSNYDNKLTFEQNFKNTCTAEVTGEELKELEFRYKKQILRKCL